MIKIGIYLQWRQLERFWRPGLYDLRCIKMMGDCDHILGRTMSRMTSSPGHWGLVTRLMMSEEEMLPGVSPEWCLLPAWLCPDWRSQSRRLERSLAELLRLRWRSLTTLCLVCLHCPPTILTPTLRLWSFNRNFQTLLLFLLLLKSILFSYICYHHGWSTNIRKMTLLQKLMPASK